MKRIRKGQDLEGLVEMDAEALRAATDKYQDADRAKVYKTIPPPEWFPKWRKFIEAVLPVKVFWDQWSHTARVMEIDSEIWICEFTDSEMHIYGHEFPIKSKSVLAEVIGEALEERHHHLERQERVLEAIRKTEPYRVHAVFLSEVY